MPDEPLKIFDLMDTETEPTDDQLEELMRYVGEAIRAKTAEIRAIVTRSASVAAFASGSDQAEGLAVH